MRKLLLTLITLLALGVSGAWATAPDVNGKTFTLQCKRGYVYYNGSILAGTSETANASHFAIVTYNEQTYLYDASQSMFVCHSTDARAGQNGNQALESNSDFSKIVKGLSFGDTGYDSYPYYLEDSWGNWLNMDGTPKVYFNTWKDFENGNGGNTYKVEAVEDFDPTEAIAMLKSYFAPTSDYNFTTTDGAFFNNLTINVNKDENSNKYCNLWLSKAEIGKPQLKLVSSNVGNDGNSGNNMSYNGGLFTTASSFTYNLSVSEGKIISYTIVGTAKGALGITPEGGTKEDFAEEASVNKKVTMSSPAKQTSFTLSTNVSSTGKWLNVTKFIVEFEKVPTVTNAASLTNSVIFTVISRDPKRGTLYANTDHVDACGGHANSNSPANPNVAIDADDANQQFVLYTYNNKKYLYNIGRAKFVGAKDGQYYKMTTTPTASWSISNASNSGYFYLTSQEDNSRACITAWSGHTWKVVGTTTNEDANNLLLTPIETTLTSEQQTAIEDVISKYFTLMGNVDKLEAHTIGTNVGEYTNANFADDAAKSTIVTGIRSAVSNYNASTLASTNETVTTAISAMQLNSVPVNAFYRIKGYATNKYAKAGSITASNVNANSDPTSYIPNSVNTESDGSDIWYYDATNHLINYKNGLGTYATRAFAALSKTKETATFQESTCTANGAKKIGVYEINSNYSGSKVWYSNTNHVDRNGSNNHVNCEWTLEEVTALPVTITDAGYASFSCPMAVTIPSGVTAFYAVDMGEYLLMRPIEDGVIPANVGVVLKATAGTYDFMKSNNAGSVSSVLTPTTCTINKPTNAYYLSNGNKGVGFYKSGNANTIKGFRAYYQGNEAYPVKSMVFDNATGIETIANTQSLKADDAIFNVAGQRVSKAQKGIYIVNGKKVLVK